MERYEIIKLLPASLLIYLLKEYKALDRYISIVLSKEEYINQFRALAREYHYQKFHPSNFLRFTFLWRDTELGFEYWYKLVYKYNHSLLHEPQNFIL